MQQQVAMVIVLVRVKEVVGNNVRIPAQSTVQLVAKDHVKVLVLCVLFN